MSNRSHAKHVVITEIFVLLLSHDLVLRSLRMPSLLLRVVQYLSRSLHFHVSKQHGSHDCGGTPLGHLSKSKCKLILGDLKKLITLSLHCKRIALRIPHTLTVGILLLRVHVRDFHVGVDTGVRQNTLNHASELPLSIHNLTRRQSFDSKFHNQLVVSFHHIEIFFLFRGRHVRFLILVLANAHQIRRHRHLQTTSKKKQFRYGICHFNLFQISSGKIG